MRTSNPQAWAAGDVARALNAVLESAEACPRVRTSRAHDKVPARSRASRRGGPETGARRNRPDGRVRRSVFAVLFEQEGHAVQEVLQSFFELNGGVVFGQ